MHWSLCEQEVYGASRLGIRRAEPWACYGRWDSTGHVLTSVDTATLNVPLPYYDHRLQASPDGLPVWQKLGFAQVGIMRGFLRGE